jgi:hypothetical protein
MLCMLTHCSFGGAGNEKFTYNDAAFLLTLTIADTALFGIKSLDDVQDMEILISETGLIPRYNDDQLIHITKTYQGWRRHE